MSSKYFLLMFFCDLWWSHVESAGLMSWVDFSGDCLRILEEWQLMSQRRAKSSFKFLGGLTSWAPNLLLDGIPDKNREWGTLRNSQKLPSKPNPYGFGPHKHARLQRFFSNSSSCLLQALVGVGGPSFLGGPWDWVCPEVGHVQVNHPHPSWRPRLCTKGLIDDSRQEFLGSTRQAEKGHLQLQGTSSAWASKPSLAQAVSLSSTLSKRSKAQGISRGWPKPP
jgi:hypothetical protein